jgi:hypothetical protein
VLKYQVPHGSQRTSFVIDTAVINNNKVKVLISSALLHKKRGTPEWLRTVRKNVRSLTGTCSGFKTMVRSAIGAIGSEARHCDHIVHFQSNLIILSPAGTSVIASGIALSGLSGCEVLAPTPLPSSPQSPPSAFPRITSKYWKIGRFSE